MKRPYFIAAALAATAVASAGFAAETSVSRPMRMDDLNGDGQITRAEFIANAEARFAKLDTNKNGVLSAAELQASRAMFGKHGLRPMGFQDSPPPPPPPGAGGPQGMRGGMAAMLDRLDTDHDGRISKAEFAAQSAERFARLDVNKEGKIDAKEINAGPGMGGRMLERADANGDGVVTRAEFDAQSAERFARLDTNGDGYIDAAERAAIQNRMGGMGRRGGPPPAGADMPPRPPQPMPPNG